MSHFPLSFPGAITPSLSNRLRVWVGYGRDRERDEIPNHHKICGEWIYPQTHFDIRMECRKPMDGNVVTIEIISDNDVNLSLSDVQYNI